MRRPAHCVAALFGPLILLGACTSDQQASVDMLNRRLQTTMKPEIADNRVALQPLPDGAVVTLLDGARLPDDVGAMDNRERDPRASMVEGLLDPSLMRLSLADTGSGTEYDRQRRIQSFTQYLTEYRLAPTLETPDPAAPQAATVQPIAVQTPPGLAVTIRVVCPPRTNWPGYGQGQSDPSCH
jgi:hypothetical protein